ncbi:MAG: succinate dehydrogenase iron-sulfur subunit [Parachlamydiales bacterium]|jgi:succinate dehydrogenase / fumarate reductase iron-sulfur subunit
MKYILKILRGNSEKQHFEEFQLEYLENSNIISALMQIQKNPINIHNQLVAPISFEMSCLEEICGACSMLINGYPRQACSTLIKPLLEKSNVITLAPLSKFYLIRDLVVDRSKMFDQLKKMKVWIETDANMNKYGLKIDPSLRDALYILSRCMTCGCCLEACPQYNHHSKFIGPSVVSQIALFTNHPYGKNIKEERLSFIINSGGVAECGNAQNCIKVCPKSIPLTESIAKMGKEGTKHILKELFSFKKKSEK